MTDRELMQQALDALQLVTDLTNHDDELYEAIDALRARLAQPEPEPVAWRTDKGATAYCNSEFAKAQGWTPIYPPQREWQGLTDEEIMDLCAAQWASHPIDVARIIEAKLKEKNT